MIIDPKWRFLIGILVTFTIGVSSGTVGLTNAIPAEWIKPAIAWCGIVAFLGSALTTAISGIGTTTANRATAAAVDPSVQKVVMNNPADATAIISPKVVAPGANVPPHA